MIAQDTPTQRIIRFSIWIAGVLIAGTIGYILIEGWTTQDAFYMSVITLATVGYGETQELSGVGRLFTCLLIFISIVCLSCWTACLTSLFVEGDLTGKFVQKRALKKASFMQDHTIVCGSNTMAYSTLCAMLRQDDNVILVDDNAANLARIRQRFPNLLIVEANPLDEIALANANLLSAKCIILALDSDFDNLMISLTCKELGTEIQVIACSNDVKVASRMMKVGVELVISPFQLSGEHAAQFASSIA